MADVLSGKVNPSGKLATTFPELAGRAFCQKLPWQRISRKSYYRFVGRSIPAEVTYEEGIYVGYRYYNTFKVKPAYEFGYGLSYTSFSYGKSYT